jgi:hypothetical protein
MSADDQEDFKKSPEFRDWLLELLTSGNNAITITFTKKDGANRVMKCTRNLSKIPDDQHPKNAMADSGSSLRVFDLDKNEWRSFVVENVTRIQYELT